ncbi:MAG: hypothetical protein VX069_10035, partial [Cyanobacteriota bacterium]|nr:hypothetical protein [Cyanobacteriota bacterium]
NGLLLLFECCAPIRFLRAVVTGLSRPFQQPLPPLFSTDSLGYLGGFLSTFQCISGVNYTLTQANNSA